MKKAAFKILSAFFVLISIYAFVKGEHATGATLAMAGGAFTTEDLNRFAENEFSNFEDFEDFEDFDDYTGEYDDFVDFGSSARSFASQINEGRTFTITYLSTLAGNQDVKLFGDSFKNIISMLMNPKTYELTTTQGKVTIGEGQSADEFIKTATLNRVSPAQAAVYTVDGVIYTAADGKGITASGSPKTIAELIAFMQMNPTVLLGFKLQNKQSVAAAESIITIKELSPFKNLEDKQLNLSTYTDENTFREGVVTVPTPNMIIGGQTEWNIPIMPGTTVLSFYFGGILNSNAALKNKTMRAETNINRAGGVKAIQKFEAKHPKAAKFLRKTSPIPFRKRR